MAIQTLFGSVPQEPNLLDRLKAGIQKTRSGLVDRLEDVVAGRKQIDAELLEELEYALITADLGVRTVEDILERIRQRVDRRLDNQAIALTERTRRRDVVECDDCAAVRMRRRCNVEDSAPRRGRKRDTNQAPLARDALQRRFFVAFASLVQNRFIERLPDELARHIETGELHSARVVAHDAAGIVDDNHAAADRIERGRPLARRLSDFFEKARIHDSNGHLIG